VVDSHCLVEGSHALVVDSHIQGAAGARHEAENRYPDGDHAGRLMPWIQLQLFTFCKGFATRLF